MSLDSAIWGPHYWFFLHTIALSYPIRPNTPTKKKYYEFIQNIPLFIPVKYCVGFMNSCLSVSLKSISITLLFPFPLNFINGFDNSLEVNKCNSDKDFPISEIVLKSL